MSKARNIADVLVSPDFTGTVTAAGNVVVGATAVGGVTSGTKTYITSTGNLYVASSGEEAAYFNRNSNDGSIVEFRKGNSAIGSIQSRSGVVSTIILDPRTGGAGLTGTGAGMTPTNNVGATSDNLCDLGKSTNRFKDLHLGGGVYLGGTGAANKLDDYEEGTWTANINGASSVANTTGYYQKIGNRVFFQYYSEAATLTAVQANITGLPFAVNGLYNPFYSGHNSATPLATGGYIGASSHRLLFVNDGVTTTATYSAGSSKYVMVAGSYITNS